MPTIHYREGYKYQLTQPLVVDIAIHPRHDIVTEYASLTAKGKLTIRQGYAWDGPSGPCKWLSELPLIGWLYRAFMLPQILPASAIHDALFWLMRWGYLDPVIHFTPANKIMRWTCMADGTTWVRAWWIYQGLQWFSHTAASSRSKKPVLTAP